MASLLSSPVRRSLPRHLLLAAVLAVLASPRPAAAEALLIGRGGQRQGAARRERDLSVVSGLGHQADDAYVTLKAVTRPPHHPRHGVHGLAERGRPAPSKMGFKAGTQLTVDNALKMMLVHSANDMAVVLAEGVGGSIEEFADEMNATAQRLGMTQTHYRQSQRPARRRPDHLGARSRHPGPRADPRIPRIQISTGTSRRSSSAGASCATTNRLIGALSGRRRHEDRLHLRLRLQSRRLRDPRQQAADRGRARRAVVAGARGLQGRCNCWKSGFAGVACRG